MIEFAVENYRDIIDEALPLLERHWNELALDRDTIPLEPDYVRYSELARQGTLHVTTVRWDGELVGYAWFILLHSLHYRSLFVADSDIFWLAPEHRRGWTGIQLLRFAEDRLAEAGVNKIIYRTKLGNHDLRVLFCRLGYSPIEMLYAKKVGS